MKSIERLPFSYTTGSKAVDVFSDITLTDQNNILVSGYGAIAGGSLGGSDLYLSLKDLRGKTIWQSDFGTTYDDAFLAVTQSGAYAYAAGFISSAPGTDRDALIAIFANVDINSSNNSPAYKAGDLVAFETFESKKTNGNLINPTDEQFNDLKISPSNNIILVGYSRGDGLISGATKSNTAASGLDKGNADGLLLIITPTEYITRLIGNSGDDIIEAVDIVKTGSLAGSIVIVGKFTSSSGKPEAYLSAFNQVGEPLWEQFLSSTGSTSNNLTSVICNDDTIYVAGTTNGLFSSINNLPSGSTRDPARTDTDVFVAAFDTTGKQLWLKQFADSPLSDISASLSISNDQLNILTGNGLDIHKIKLTKNGELLLFDVISSGSNGIDIPESIVSDNFGNSIIVGSSSGTWQESVPAGSLDALIHFSGPQMNSYQLDISPLDDSSKLTSTSFNLALKDQTYSSFIPNKYSALTGYLTINQYGEATYEPYPELPSIYSWQHSLKDNIIISALDSINNIVPVELRMNISHAPSKPPINYFTLEKNQVQGDANAFGLSRPEIILNLNDNNYSTTDGANKKLSAFAGNTVSVSLQLAIDKAPITGLNLMRYARDGYYDNTIFHRIIDGFMVQGGGYDISKPQSIGFAPSITNDPIPLEGTQISNLSNTKGMLSMARTNDPHSATNQFFINLVDNKFLDDQPKNSNDFSASLGYSAFGAISDGFEIFDQIASAPKRNTTSGGNSTTWGAPKSGSLFQDITEPIVVITKTELLAKPSNLNYSIDKLPQFGSININNITGKFLYTPNSEYKGADSFSVLTTSPALLGLPARSVSQEYYVSGQLVVAQSTFNLDVDGDGKVTALGDGLMVIRKLFGAAFAGDALTNKAISPSSTRTTTEIHEFIQQGITTGLLDVDKDGKTTALGDGLMVIRHLFGAAFAGEALTNKAISPSSPYFGTSVDHLAIANAIDLIKVIPGRFA